MHFHARITGTGSYLPPRVVPNSELEKILHTTDEWIRQKIGVCERRYVADGVGCSDLAVAAAKNALQAAQKKPTDIQCILMATSTPDHFAPGAGVHVQHKLGCHKIPAFDIRNTSPGFLFALELGDQLIRAGKYDCILVVASEVHSTGLDFSERGRLMTVIFGDGAGAVILEASEGPHGILSTKLHSDGTNYDKLWCEAPSAKHHPAITPAMIAEGRVFPTMDGRFVFDESTHLMGLVAEEVLVANNINEKQIDHVVPHQANLRIMETLAGKLNIPMQKVHCTIQKYGNTNAASIPITLDEAVRAGKISEKELVLMVSFGSGLSWGAGLVRW